MVRNITKMLRFILWNQLAIMTALYYVPELPEEYRKQIIRFQEETADFLEGKK